ncbi:unnamed protein product, partial [Polarella glacialis]
VALFGFGVQALAGGEDEVPLKRSLTDEEVLASQRFFSVQWRKRFNAGDLAYCGQAYTQDAAFHATFGPMAQEVQRLIFLPSPAILHGRDLIEAFWNSTYSTLGFKDLVAYQEDGKFSSSGVVVDDNTVLVQSAFSFDAAEGKKVLGQIFSEMWVRNGQRWKLRSTMLAIEDVQPAVPAVPAVPVVVPGRRRRSEASQIFPDDGIVPTPKKFIAAAKESHTKDDFPPAVPAMKPVVLVDSDSKKAAPDALQKAGLRVKETPTKATAAGLADAELVSPTASKRAAGSSLLIGLMVLVTCGAAGVFVRRAKNRQEASVAGFEAMLG